MNWYWRLERLGLKYSKAEESDWERWWAAGTRMCFLDPGTSDYTLRTDISLTHRGLEKKMMVQTSGKWFIVFISDVKMLRYGHKSSASLTNVRHFFTSLQKAKSKYNRRDKGSYFTLLSCTLLVEDCTSVLVFHVVSEGCCPSCEASATVKAREVY